MDFIPSDYEVVDHKKHNTLDNREFNLQIVPASKNSSNRNGANKNSKTGIRNVHWIESANEYWVQIMRKGERFKWIFKENQFEEACNFAEIKRKELFGKHAGYGTQEINTVNNIKIK